MRALFIIVFGSFWLTGSLGQPPGFSLEHLNSTNGLSHDFVTCIFKDREGYMWFGTKDGLNRYDGYGFTVFKKRSGEQNTIAGNEISGITQDITGVLWVTTTEGVSRYCPVTESFETFPLREDIHTLDHLSNPVAEREGKNVYISTGNILFDIDVRTLKYVSWQLGERTDEADKLFMDNHDRLWRISGGEPFRFDSRVHLLKRYNEHPGRKPLLGNSFFETPEGDILLCTRGSGICRLEEGKDRFQPLNGTENDDIVCVTTGENEAGASVYWISARASGLGIQERLGGPVTPIACDPTDPCTHNDGLTTCLYRDKETGIVWIGTETGVEKYDPVGISWKRELLTTRLTSDGEGLPVSFAETGGVDSGRGDKRRRWLGIPGTGLVEWCKVENRLCRIGGAGKGSLKMITSHDQRLWIGLHGGVEIYDPERKNFYRLPGFFEGSDTSLEVTALFEDSRRKMWIGTKRNGLFRYDGPGQLLPVRLTGNEAGKGTACMHVTGICEDTCGRIWVSTRFGLDRITGDRAEPVALQGPVRLDSNGGVTSFYCDSEGRLWIGTGSGLIGVDEVGRLLKQYTASYGFDLGSVRQIMEARDRVLWVLTSSGLYKVDVRKDLVIGQTRTDGFLGSGQTGGIYCSKEGEVFAGFRGGFEYLSPEKINAGRKKDLPLVMGWVKVGEKDLAYPTSADIRMGPGDKVVTLGFALLNYSTPEKNQYYYTLEGPVTIRGCIQRNQLSLYNLPGGVYELIIRAKDGTGQMVSGTIRLRISVDSPFTGTLWFKLFWMICVGGIAGAIFYFRARNYRYLVKMREIIAKDLHDDIGSTLSGVTMFSEVLRRRLGGYREDINPILDRISDDCRSLMTSMSEIIWAIQVDQDRLEDLTVRMREFALSILESRGIKFNLYLSDNLRKKRLAIQQKRLLYLIFKESVNNALKYAQCSEINVFIIISSERKKNEMIIKDDGIGFDMEEVRNGNGLRNMRARAGEMEASLEIHSSPGNGTLIELFF